MVASIKESFTATGVSERKAMRSGAISIAGTFSGTVAVQRYMNGDWRTLQTYTAPAEDTFDNGVECEMRVTCTAYSSGSADCELLGSL